MSQDNPPQNPRSPWRVLGNFLVWAAAVIIGPLVPWLQPLFNHRLISDYFRETYDPVASLFAAIAFLAGGILCWRTAKARVQIYLAIAASIFAVCFVTCEVFTATVGELFDPGQVGTVVIRVAWKMVYLVTFASLGYALSLLALLFGRALPQ